MKNKRAVNAVDAILELLDTPDKWTQGLAARDANGDSVYSSAPEAVCWCLEGAICKVFRETNRPWSKPYFKMKRALTRVLKDDYISFNDKPTTTYEDIINALKQAKEYLKEDRIR